MIERVFEIFREFSKIPHGSGNTKQISDYLVNFAKERNLEHYQDELNNVIIIKEAGNGFEAAPPVIIQGHMDMVCAKDPDCTKDMEKEGIDIETDGVYMYANGTTLGGDDGIAVAYALAILADKSIPHPPLEVIITVDEEIGMLGADAIDLSMLKGRMLLNIDSEEEGVFTVSCAGGATATLTLPGDRRPVYGPCIKLTVDGLAGGHSGVEIHKNRANANKIMGEFLGRVQQLMPVCITSISGGAKDNAIPRSCQVTLVALGMNPERINDIAADLQAEVRANYDEPDAVICGDNVEALGGNALSTEQSAKVIALLNAVPNGVQVMSSDIPGLVQTSLNLGILSMKEDLTFTFSVRSSVNSEKEELLAKLKELVEFYDGTYTQMGDYPAWEYKADSLLRDTMVAVYEKMFAKKPEVLAIHAGLECGLLGEKLPGLDAVSIGPQMYDIHTSRERLEIASVERMWNYILELLKAL